MTELEGKISAIFLVVLIRIEHNQKSTKKIGIKTSNTRVKTKAKNPLSSLMRIDKWLEVMGTVKLEQH